MKRILTISNECFSEKTSNGRTISKLLSRFSSDELAQFYIHGEPDYSTCVRYYSVSDRDALNAFLFRTSKRNPMVKEKDFDIQKQKNGPQENAAGVAACIADEPLGLTKSAEQKSKRTEAGTEKLPENHGTIPAEQQKIQRSCKNLVLRDIVWRSNRWWKKDFSEFLREFSPEVVLLQAGDSPFMYAIARKIAKRFHASLVMFNTENYVLKKRLYAGAKEKSIWHLLLRHRLRVQYRRFMKKADFCIYNTQWLEEAYQKAYPHSGKSRTFYVATQLQPAKSEPSDGFRVTYCGNLGVGRTTPLHEFARVLQRAIPEATLNIYGKFQTARERSAFETLPNVRYFGVVPYEQIPAILAASTLVLHCENPKRAEDLRYAFSTKIADSLACGRPFLVYASREYPFVNYLAEHKCAHIASSPEELYHILTACKDRAFCDSTLDNAHKLANENHSVRTNAEEMHQILCSL